VLDDLLDLALGVLELGLLHLQPEVVALAGSFADPGKDGVAAVLAGDPGDHLLDDHGLAQTRPAEQPGLAPADEGGQQVDDLDAGDQRFGLGDQIGEVGRFVVDRSPIVGGDRSQSVDGLAEQVEDSTEDSHADRYGHRGAGVADFHAAFQPVGAAQGHRPDSTAAQVTGHLTDKHLALGLLADLALDVDGQGIVQVRHLVLGELGIQGGADDLGDSARVQVGGNHLSFSNDIRQSIRRGNSRFAQEVPPAILLSQFVIRYSPLLQRFRPADDIQEFQGDLALPGPVELAG
jgi:hypothetical protein